MKNRFFNIFNFKFKPLLLTLVSVLTCATAGATTYTVTTFSDLTSKLGSATYTDVVKLGSNITATSAINFTTTHTVTLDLNGYTLSGAYNNLITINHKDAILDVQDSKGGGKIEMNFSCASASTAIQVTKGTFILEGGTVYAKNTNTSYATCAINVESGQYVDLAGGRVEAYSNMATIGVKCTGSSKVYVGNSVTKNPGYVYVETTGTAKPYGIQVVSGGSSTINVYAGTVEVKTTTGQGQGVRFDGYGTLNMHGGTIKTDCKNATYGVYLSHSSSEANIYSGASVDVTSTNSTASGIGGSGTLTINSGASVTVKGKSAVSAGLNHSNSTDGKAWTVNGGTFTVTTTTDVEALGLYEQSTKGSFVINGGKFMIKSNNTAISKANAVKVKDGSCITPSITGGFYNINTGFGTGTPPAYCSPKTVQSLSSSYTDEAALLDEGYQYRVAGTLYTVTFKNSESNAVTATVRTENGSKPDVPEAATADYVSSWGTYEFNGWSLTDNGTAIDLPTITANTTLWAKTHALYAVVNGEKKYSVADAWTAAFAKTHSWIRIMTSKDNISDDITWNGKTATTITLNLNNHHWGRTSGTRSYENFICLNQSGAVLTVVDSTDAKNGYIHAGWTSAWEYSLGSLCCILLRAGELKLKSGSIRCNNAYASQNANAVNMWGGSFTMTGGTLEAKKEKAGTTFTGGDATGVASAGTVTISGGTIKAVSPAAKGQCVSRSSGTVTISGSPRMYAVGNTSANSKVVAGLEASSVSGGYYSNTNADLESKCADGKHVVPASLTEGGVTYNYQVAEAEASVTINGVTTYYAKFYRTSAPTGAWQAANTSASYPATIKILKDITISSSLTYDNSNNKNCTLDLNGHTITGSASARNWLTINNSNITFTITDGTDGKLGKMSLTSTYNSNSIRGVYVQAGTLQLQAGTIEIISGSQETRGVTVYSESGTATFEMTGGTIHVQTSNSKVGYGVYNSTNGTTTISGGTIHVEAAGNGYGLNRGANKITVTGGKFKVTSDATAYVTNMSSANSNYLDIQGGYFNIDTQLGTCVFSPKHVLSLASAYETYYNYKVATAYNLTWDYNGGSVSSAGTPAGLVEVGATVTAPTLTKTGYNFSSWSPSVVSPMPSSDKSYTAQWTEKTYTVTFYNGGHGSVQVAGSTISNGSTASVNHFTTKTLGATASTGYHFTGWTYTGSVTIGNTSSASTNIKATATGGTVTASWAINTYSVRFNKNDEGATGTMSNESFTYGTAKALTANAFTNGTKVFLGWATSDGGDVVYTDGQSVNNLTATNGATVDLYAKWADSDLSVKVGSTTKYYTQAQMSDAVTYAKTGNCTITVVRNFSTANVLTYNPGTARDCILDLNSKTITYTGSAQQFLTVTSSGKTFTIQNTGGGANGKIYVNPASGYNGSLYGIKLTAGTLQFNAGTVSVVQTYASKKGFAIYASGGTVNVAGGTISSESKAGAQGINLADGTSADISGGTITANLSVASGGDLIALNIGAASVTISGGTFRTTVLGETGGAAGNNPDVIHIVPGADVSISDGTFSTNATDGNAVRLHGGEIYITGGTFTAYNALEGGAWATATGSTTATISISGGTFTANGGKVINAGYSSHDGKTVNSDITIDGGKFRKASGSYNIVTCNANSSLAVNGGYFSHNSGLATYVTASNKHVCTLSPAYETYYYYKVATAYNLTWNYNGGSVSSAGTPAGYVEVGATVTAPTLTKTGYDFSSWSPSVVSPMPSSDKSYTAQWTEKTYTVTFYNGSHGTVKVNGSTISNGGTASIKHFTTQTLVATASTGYNFAGWTRSTNSITIGNTSNASTTIKSTATGSVTATWSAKTYTISLDREGGTSGATSVTATYNSSSLTGWSAPTRTGYTFGGYYSGDDGTGTLVISSSGVLQASVTISSVAWTNSSSQWVKDAGVTLYAKWTCVDPSSLSIASTGSKWDFCAGESMTLTVDGDDIASDATYQWNLNGSPISGATSSTYTVASMALANAGTYTCTVTNGTCDEITSGYDIKVWTFYHNASGEYAHGNLTYSSAGKGTISIHLAAGQTYEFKLNNNMSSGNWFGNTGTITGTIAPASAWVFGSSVSNNCKIKAGLEGDYVFMVDYSNSGSPKVSVTYPTADQEADNIVYWDASIHGEDWSKLVFRVGTNSNNNAAETAKTDANLVPGTDQFYAIKTCNFGDMTAWTIADNVGWTGSNSVYKTKTNDSYAITKSIEYQHYAVVDPITIVPTTTGSIGSEGQNDNCTFYTLTKYSGMLTHTVTITTPTHGSIHIAYTDASGSDQDKTSTTSGITHRCILTITAEADAGYKPKSLKVNGLDFISGRTFILDADASITATFEETTLRFTTEGNWSNASNWTPACVPTIKHKVYIQKPCSVDITNAKAKQIMIRNGWGGYTGKLTVGPNKGLEVNTTITTQKTSGGDELATTPSDLVLESSSAGNASLIFDNSNSCQATVQMYSKASFDGSTTVTWQYIGVPFVGTSNAKSLYYGSWLYEWGASGGSYGWIAVPNGGDVNPWTGYCITQSAAATYEMTGTLCSTTIDRTPYTVDAESEMVYANSFTAPIQIKQFTDGDFSNVTKKIYLFNTGFDDDNNAGEANSRYEAGTYITIPIHSSPYTGDSLISSMQAFILKNPSGSSGSVTLNYDRHVRPSRATDAIVAGEMHAPSRRTSEVGEPTVMKLFVSGSRYDSRLVVLAREDFSTGHDDGWDGENINEAGVGPLMYALREDGTKDAVSAIPYYEGTVVGFHKGEDNTYTFSFQYDGDEILYLNDLQAQESTLISEGNTYSFWTDENDAETRFIISATPIAKNPTGVEGAEANSDNAAVVRKVIINDKVYIIRGGRVYSAVGGLVK